MAAALRAKHVAAGLSFAGKRAIVVGATSGIGEGAALRLAEAGFSVAAVGRDAERGAAVVEAMNKAGGSGHSFVPCDAFSLKNVEQCAGVVKARKEPVDVLFLSQGMATMDGFTPTPDGNDRKLTLHWFSRAAFINELLPQLRAAEGGARVISILSAGFHAPYPAYKDDFGLQKPGSYSLSNAANAAGYYNDLGLDALAVRPENEKIAFIHTAPGGVRTRWGDDFPWYLRAPLSLLKKLPLPFLRTPLESAEFTLDPVFRTLPDLRRAYNGPDAAPGVMLTGSNAQPVSKTAAHTPADRDAVWEKTAEVLRKAGLQA